MGNYIYRNGVRENQVLSYMQSEDVIRQAGQIIPVETKAGYLVILEGHFSVSLGREDQFELRFYDEGSGIECCPAKVKVVYSLPSKKNWENSLVYLEEIEEEKTKA